MTFSSLCSWIPTLLQPESSDDGLNQMGRSLDVILGMYWALELHSACGVVDLWAVRGTLAAVSTE